jgi:uncharacterized protein
VRIPGWCESASLTVNGRPVRLELKPATFVKIEREFAPGDVVKLSLPMKVKLTTWGEGGVALERGPLLFSLKIEEDRQPATYDPGVNYLGLDKPDPAWPEWNIMPKSPWNYALAVDPAAVAKEVRVILRPMPSRPWDVGNAPIELRAPAKRVKGWNFDFEDSRKIRRWLGFNSVKGPDVYTFTPDFPEKIVAAEKTEEINLVPLGATRLRMTVFPPVPQK